MRNNIQLLPVIASIGIGAVTYSMMTGRSGQLANVIPQLASVGSQGMDVQRNRAKSTTM